MIRYYLRGDSIIAARYTYHSFTEWDDHPWSRQTNGKGQDFRNEWTIEEAEVHPSGARGEWRPAGRCDKPGEPARFEDVRAKLLRILRGRQRDRVIEVGKLQKEIERWEP